MSYDEYRDNKILDIIVCDIIIYDSMSIVYYQYWIVFMYDSLE